VRLRSLVLLGATALLVVASVLAPMFDRGSTYELTFAPGSAERIDATLFDGVPHRRIGDVVWLELEPGDTLIVENRDDEVHQIAGVAARPGERVLHTFRERGTFSDECSLDLTVFVEVERR
jgi:uncharacterized Zn-binding protein involved in type VI secretion